MTLFRLALTLCLWPALAFALAPPPVPPENPSTEQKRILGKLLFWDEQLASDSTVACGTCHQFKRAGSDGRTGIHPGLDETYGTADDVVGSPGVVRRDAGGHPVNDPLFGFARQVTMRNAPQVPGALWAPEIFVDGRARSAFVDPQTGEASIAAGGALESQAVVPLLAAREMATDNRTWADVIARVETAMPMALATYLPADMKAVLAGNPSYPDLFAQAFGSPVVTAARIAFALATYERTLVADQTPFDLGTMTPQQQQGLAAFMANRSACNGCHVAPLFTDNSFRNIGLRPIGEDIGRQAVTGLVEDAGRFKVPTVRNVGLKKFFMHNGRLGTLEEVVDFYFGSNGQVQFPDNQDPLMFGMAIGVAQRADLIEFMRNGLTDPRVASAAFPFDQPILRSERGDPNDDGAVDAADRALFTGCHTGANLGPVANGCERLDMDGDADIDCADWDAFTRVWTGAAPPQAFQACAVFHAIPVGPGSPRLLFAFLAMMMAAGALTLRWRRGG